MTRLPKIILTLALILTIACCCLMACNNEESGSGISDVSKKTTEEPLSGKNWMSKIDGSTLLSNITIPGTHDTGAYNAVGINIFGQTQSLSLDRQLEAGARALDIRLVYVEGVLKVYHGFLDVNLTFDEVLETTGAFLAANPQEVIVMSVQQEDYENEEEFRATTKSAINDSNLFYTENRIPTLGEVRGKIVLLRRYDVDGDFGIDCAEDWDSSAPCTFSSGDIAIHLQDNYSISGEETLETKWNDILALYDLPEAKSGDLFINFSSCVTYNVIGSYEIPDVKKAADIINERILTEFPTLGRKFFGIFFMDFISAELAETLYGVNF